MKAGAVDRDRQFGLLGCDVSPGLRPRLPNDDPIAHDFEEHDCARLIRIARDDCLSEVSVAGREEAPCDLADNTIVFPRSRLEWRREMWGLRVVSSNPRRNDRCAWYPRSARRGCIGSPPPP